MFKSRLKPNERLLVLAVLDHWSQKNPVPRPGVARLVRWTGFVRQTVLTLLDGLFAQGVFPDPRPRDASGALLRTTRPLTFDVSQLVQRLDQLTSLPPRPKRARPTGLTVGHQLVYGLDSTGLSDSRAKHQNGSRSAEEGKKKAMEEGTSSEASRNASDVFALQPPTTEGTKTKSRKRTKTERPPEQIEAHKATVQAYLELFERHRGRRPVFGKAEGQAVYDLLEKLEWNVAAARARISAGLESWEQATIRTIASDPDRQSQRAPVRVQRGGLNPSVVVAARARAAALRGAE